MSIDVKPLFHVAEDVCVPSTGEFGYIFAISEQEHMMLVRSFDGKTDGWFHPHELTHLTLEAGSTLLEGRE